MKITRLALLSVLLPMLNLSPAVAGTTPERPVNLIQMVDTPQGRQVTVVGSTAGQALYPDQLKMYDDMPRTLIKSGYIAHEDYVIMYITYVNRSLTRIMYVGNKGTALSIDFTSKVACALGVGDSGPMAKDCVSLPR